LNGLNDILETTFNVNNNQVSPLAVQGLAFDSSVSRSASITYSVYRTSTAAPSGHAETGQLSIVYDNNASVNSKWQMTQSANGTSGIVFTISDLGQVSYISSDIGTTGYQGLLKFSAKSTAI